jgi:NAD(P)-dependent dehydrogenase (short-subunit alcohol dehydrogenase family)
MGGKLSGKVAIVTGAAQGIDASYAAALSAEGALVCVSDVLDMAVSVAAAKAAGGDAFGISCDVTDCESVKSMVDATFARWGRVDILVNNAGIFGKLSLTPLTEISSAEFDKVLSVNVRGSFECAKAVVPHMRKRGYGKIINVASGTVFKGAPMLLHYVTSKGAVIAMTRSLARELGDSGIRVNAIAPGLVMSESVVANPSWKGAVVENNVASRCIKREAQPDDVVGTLVFLCSPDSDFITGQTIVRRRRLGHALNVRSDRRQRKSRGPFGRTRSRCRRDRGRTPCRCRNRASGWAS